MGQIKIQIISKNSRSLYPTKTIEREVESVAKTYIDDEEKEQLKEYLRKLFESVRIDKLDQEAFVKVVELSPRVDDSSLLNKMIADIEVWKSYSEDADFPLNQYYEEFIKVV